MNFSVIPHIGVDKLQFGMSRSTIQAQLVGIHERFFRGETEDTDYYASLGLFVLYNHVEICVAIEFTRPARVLFTDVSLLSLSKKKAVALFQDNPDFEQDESGFTRYLYGIGAYYEEPQRAESVIVFQPNYYSK